LGCLFECCEVPLGFGIVSYPLGKPAKAAQYIEALHRESHAILL
jgi:hypothetical protein